MADKKPASKNSTKKTTAKKQQSAFDKAKDAAKQFADNKPKSASQPKSTGSGTAKSKEQQKKDIGKIAVAAAAAGGVAGAVASKAAGGGKKGKRLAAVISVIVAIVVLATGLLYYYDVPPLDFDLGGNFKYYSMPNVAYSDGDLRVHFLDVGQGDCILIELPDGKNMLIDSGKNDSALESKIIKYIKEDFGISIIHYGMLTHADEDHSGGFDKIIRDPDITFLTMYQPLLKADPARTAKCYVDSKYNEYVSNRAAMTDANRLPEKPAYFSQIQMITTKVYADFIEAVADEKDSEGNSCEVIFSYEGQVIEGEGYKITLYNPNYEMYRSVSTAAKKNNVSPIMILEFNDYKILLTGDADDEAEVNFLGNAGDAADVDILKVAHHGGSQSTSTLFLSKATPAYSVISVGKNNYGHPTSAVMSRLKDVKSKVFRTDEKGNVVLTLNGSKFGWKFFKDGQNYGDASDYVEESAKLKPLAAYNFNFVNSKSVLPALRAA